MQFINFQHSSNRNQNGAWKLFLKIGIICILIGYIIYILKELIVGLISLIFILLGGYFFYLAFINWRMHNYFD